MKTTKRIVVLLLVLAMVLLCGGCAALMEKAENAEIRSLTEAMLDALIADDFEGAYGLVKDVCSEQEFASAYKGLRGLLGSSGSYELKLMGISSKSTLNDGEKTSTVSATYLVECGNGKFLVDVVMKKEGGLLTFYLTPYEKTGYYSTGLLSNMEGASTVQWGLLLTNLIGLGLVGFSFVDCCRHKMKNKALWMFLILLGFVSFAATLGNSGIRLNFRLTWVTGYTALIHYGSEEWMLRVMVPAGAIGYLLARTNLLKKATTPTVYPEPIQPDTNME